MRKPGVISLVAALVMCAAPARAQETVEESLTVAAATDLLAVLRAHFFSGGGYGLKSVAGFAGFATTGLFTAVAPSFLSDVVGIDNHATAGAIVCSIFASSALAQLAALRADPQRAVAFGCAVLIAGMAILALAVHFASLALMIAAAVVCGIGQGVSFGRGLAAVSDCTPADRRAEVTSTYFVVAYIALSLPVMGEGLAAQAWGLDTAGLTFAVAVAVLAAGCLAAILARETRRVRV